MTLFVGAFLVSSLAIASRGTLADEEKIRHRQSQGVQDENTNHPDSAFPSDDENDNNAETFLSIVMANKQQWDNISNWKIYYTAEDGDKPGSYRQEKNLSELLQSDGTLNLSIFEDSGEYVVLTINPAVLFATSKHKDKIVRLITLSSLLDKEIESTMPHFKQIMEDWYTKGRTALICRYVGEKYPNDGPRTAGFSNVIYQESKCYLRSPFGKNIFHQESICYWSNSWGNQSPGIGIDLSRETLLNQILKRFNLAL